MKNNIKTIGYAITEEQAAAARPKPDRFSKPVRFLSLDIFLKVYSIPTDIEPKRVMSYSLGYTELLSLITFVFWQFINIL
ncbi:MAG: hypothetical protein DRR16_03345 [Candidatus Parabeggiatoa sp. nov. 3]|nr:MAG: hypothetical protein DRR00_28915 [Gammaproteobacteria bacterium]RKZ53101.1 MAG: hypothetical protein DRQ99_31985 [Gammaproteobacteria bacterium]RKZ89101.1 MAG: hypothetical protein DRR16_03345 [Gammaproteobacteria bacterium]HEW98965.1 hypothetical protein [Beggiatoa sp.]